VHADVCHVTLSAVTAGQIVQPDEVGTVDAVSNIVVFLACRIEVLSVGMCCQKVGGRLDWIR